MISDSLRRDKYMASALIEGDTAESYIAQVWRSVGGLELIMFV